MVVPLIVNITLFSLALWGAASQLGPLSQALEELLPDWLDFLSVLLVPLFVLLSLGVIFFLFSLVANVIAAPFNGLLAEAVERRLRAERGEQMASAKFKLSDVMRDASVSVLSEFRKLGYFLPRALAIGLLYFVPGLNLAAAPLWFLFSAWMLSISYMDYPMGNHQLGFREQRDELKRCRLTSLGFGAVVTAGVLIPIANLVIMPAAVAGATKFWVERVAPYRGVESK